MTTLRDEIVRRSNGKLDEKTLAYEFRIALSVSDEKGNKLFSPEEVASLIEKFLSCELS